MFKSFLISLGWLSMMVLASVTYSRGKVDGLLLFTVVMTLGLAYVTYQHNKQQDKLG
jgi:hypothetical protein